MIKSLIPKVSAFIKDYCNRSLIDYSSTDKTEISSTASDTFYLIEAPVISVTSVAYSLDYGQTYTAMQLYTEYAIDKESDAIVNVGGSFPGLSNGLKVIYKGGYSAAPEPLKQGAIELMTYFLKNEGTPRKSTTQARLSIEYITSSNLPAHIVQLLNNYRYVNY